MKLSKKVLLLTFFLLLGAVVGKWMTPVLPKEEDIPAINEYLKNHFQNRPISWEERKVDLSSSIHDRKNDSIENILSRLSKSGSPENWNEELKKLLSLTPHFKASEVLSLFFLKWAESDFDEAMAGAGKVGFRAFSLKKELFYQLIEKDPLKAFQYYTKNKDSLKNHDYIIEEVAQKLSAASSEKAWEWCLCLEDMPELSKSEKEAALIGFIDGMDLKDPLEVHKYLEKVDAVMSCIPQGFIKRWGKTSPGDVMDWIMASPDREERYIAPAILGITENDLPMAEELMGTLKRNKQMPLIADMARVITGKEGGEKALSWVLTQANVTEENERDCLLMPLSSWIGTNPDDSQQWVLQLPSSPIKDIAIKCYVESLYEISFEDNVLDMIGQMEDSSQKEELINYVKQKRGKGH